MEIIREIALRRGPAAIVRRSSERLNDAEFSLLHQAMVQMADRYPHQDLTDSLEGFEQDTERVAARYGLNRVLAVLAEIRITPGQIFFPRPDEIAQKCEELMASERQQFLQDHPYTPCEKCDGMGMIVTRREDGKFFAEDCECKRAWRRSCNAPSEATIERGRAAGQ